MVDEVVRKQGWFARSEAKRKELGALRDATRTLADVERERVQMSALGICVCALTAVGSTAIGLMKMGGAESGPFDFRDLAAGVGGQVPKEMLVDISVRANTLSAGVMVMGGELMAFNAALLCIVAVVAYRWRGRLLSCLSWAAAALWLSPAIGYMLSYPAIAFMEPMVNDASRSYLPALGELMRTAPSAYSTSDYVQLGILLAFFSLLTIGSNAENAKREMAIRVRQPV